jgi:hypothetical protein
VTVNSKEENSLDFCSNYAQEFGLWSACSTRIGEMLYFCSQQNIC